MLTQSSAIIGPARLAGKDEITKAARLFWLASQSVRDLVRDGHFARADFILTEMAVAGAYLIAGNFGPCGILIGEQIRRLVNDLGPQCRAGISQ
jgi:hypothetical protein